MVVAFASSQVPETGEKAERRRPVAESLRSGQTLFDQHPSALVVALQPSDDTQSRGRRDVAEAVTGRPRQGQFFLETQSRLWKVMFGDGQMAEVVEHLH